MDAQLRQYLSRIAEALEQQNKILRRFVPEEDGESRCPACGSTEIENTSAMGNPRMTCGDCAESWEGMDG